MSDQVLVQIASYNGNMQGDDLLAQDLVDWLAPTLTTSQFLAHRAPSADILVVGFQELLPLHLGFAGLSAGMINSRDALIRAEIEKHNKVPYVLVGKIVSVGVAMLVYAKDGEQSIARRIRDVETQFTSFGPAWMGNKGSVALRFRLLEENEPKGPGELYTFVCSHLTAHAKHYTRRLENYQHLVKTLLFSPVSQPGKPSTIYDSTHLFFFGDLNFRLTKPGCDQAKDSGLVESEVLELNTTLDGRRQLIEHDQLKRAQREGKALIGLREGEVEQFPVTFKYKIGTVDTYSSKRTPSWTDRILYATASDADLPHDQSHIKNILYTSILAFTKSDHKPITAMLLVPSSSASASSSTPGIPPLIKLPPHSLDLAADPRLRLISRLVGKPLDWLVGWLWCFFWYLGFGHANVGVGNFVLGGVGALVWWKRLWFF